MSGKSVSTMAALDERRGFDRIVCAIPTTCQPPSGYRKDPWPATICNLSNSGVGLSLNRRFEKGSGLAIELPTEDGGTTTVLGRVVFLQANPAGGWLLGCHLVSELSDEEVRSVLDLGMIPDDEDSDEPPPPHVCINGVLFQMRVGQNELLRWYVKRLDMTGSWPLKRGTVVSFRVGTLADVPVEILIKRCRRYGSYWVINGLFLAEPSPAVLRLLSSPV